MKTDPAATRGKLYDLLGDLPDRHRKITAQTVGVETRGTYVLERLVLDLNGIETVPALFVRPVKMPAGKKKLPAILYNHAHGGDYKLGKTEMIDGRAAIFSPPYAEAPIN